MNKTIIRLSHYIFLISSLTFFLYLVLEFFFEGLISNYFDLHILLIVVVVSGIVPLVLGRKE